MPGPARSTIVSLLFTAFVGPGPIAVLIPWLLTGWQWEAVAGWRLAARWMGWVLIAAGVPGLLGPVARFVYEGRGTLAPIMPTERLVVHGAYRYVRNPMYVAVMALIAGQAMVFQHWNLALYGVAVFLVFHLFVLLYEEPTLGGRYGAEYARYCCHVPRWLPRATPWRGDDNRNV